MAWKVASSSKAPTVNWEETKIVEGEIIQHKAVSVKGFSGEPETRNLIIIKKKDGEDIAVWISAGLSALHDLPDGTDVRITSEGRKKNPKTGRYYNSFLVEFNDESIPEAF